LKACACRINIYIKNTPSFVQLSLLLLLLLREFASMLCVCVCVCVCELYIIHSFQQFSTLLAAAATVVVMMVVTARSFALPALLFMFSRWKVCPLKLNN